MRSVQKEAPAKRKTLCHGVQVLPRGAERRVQLARPRLMVRWQAAFGPAAAWPRGLALMFLRHFDRFGFKMPAEVDHRDAPRDLLDYLDIIGRADEDHSCDTLSDEVIDCSFGGLVRQRIEIGPLLLDRSNTICKQIQLERYRKVTLPLKARASP
jgi:hypothetical protein